MDRKRFFQSFLTAGLTSFLAGKAFASETDEYDFTVLPKYLKPGDTVGITCPAGNVDLVKLQPCTNVLRLWGLDIKLGKTVGTHWQRFSGTDAERLADFQSMLDDDNIKAIIFGKGGYGTMRIIDQLNWKKFRQHPKWLVGYSDLTIVHLHVHHNCHIPTIHGDMGTGFSDDPSDPSARSIQKALFGEQIQYTVPACDLNRTGKASGKLVGGNLTLLHAASGSKSDISTDGKILFIEDVTEYKYSIDRMMMSLKRSGKLEKLAGLIVGGFTSIKESAEETFSIGVEEIIMEKVAEYDYPVCFHFPAGHIKDNRALKFGVGYELEVADDQVILNERLHISSLNDFRSHSRTSVDVAAL